MLTYYQNKHRFFDGLVVFLASACSLAIGLQAQGRGTTAGFKPTDKVVFQGRPNVTNLELWFFPHDLLQTIVHDEWPAKVDLEARSLTKISPNMFVLRGVVRLHMTMAQVMFVHYFEAIRATVEGKYGGDPYVWPPILNFARVVRNAFAHGGEITIDNPQAPPVTWRTLSYTAANNGQQIMYQDLTPAEVILLMDDMDSVV